eukprot:7059058-Pyramimonas_sp.AAC.2
MIASPYNWPVRCDVTRNLVESTVPFTFQSKFKGHTACGNCKTLAVSNRMPHTSAKSHVQRVGNIPRSSFGIVCGGWFCKCFDSPISFPNSSTKASPSKFTPLQTFAISSCCSKNDTLGPRTAGSPKGWVCV